MKRVLVSLATVAALAAPGWAQLDPNNSDGDNGGFTLTPTLEADPLTNLRSNLGEIEDVQRERVNIGAGATLRALDKLAGTITDIEVGNGESARFGRLDVLLSECRYPTENPSGDAFGHLIIEDRVDSERVFEGWMVASSPALNALDHPRYDVWVLRCKTS